MTNTSEPKRRVDTANVGNNPEVAPQPTFPLFSSVSLPNPSQWHFDIDEHLNKIVPPPPWKYVPYPVAYMLGHRKGKLPEIGNIAMIFWAAIGIFCSIILIELASRRIHALEQNGTLIVASFVSSPANSRTLGTKPPHGYVPALSPFFVTKRKNHSYLHCQPQHRVPLLS